jgi:hypothetical protein
VQAGSGWDGVEIVYNAKEERERKVASTHKCTHIQPHDYEKWMGTVTVCPDCGTYWHLAHNLFYEGCSWKKVRWWNFKAKGRIANG